MTDHAMLDEIFLVGTNDSELYRRHIVHIISSLRRKVARGTYDATLALKLWQYAADDMVKQYAADQMGLKPTLRIVPKADRAILAENLAARYAEEVHG